MASRGRTLDDMSMGTLSCDSCKDYAEVDDERPVAAAQIAVFVAAHPHCNDMRLQLTAARKD